MAPNPLVMRRIGTNKGRGVRENKKMMIQRRISAVGSVSRGARNPAAAPHWEASISHLICHRTGL